MHKTCYRLFQSETYALDFMKILKHLLQDQNVLDMYLEAIWMNIYMHEYNSGQC